MDDMDQAQFEKQHQLLQEKYDSLVARIKTISLQNRDQSEFISSVLDEAPFGFLVFNSDRRINKFNNTASHLLGTVSSTLVGRTCDAFFRCYCGEGSCPVLDHGKQLHQQEIQGVGQLDGKVYLRSCKSTIEQEQTLVIETFVDITEEKKAHESLLQAYQMKESFLARINHEIRTPLNGIIGLAELLSSEVEEGDFVPESLANSLTEIVNAGYRLKDIFDKLLYYNEISRNVASLNPIAIEIDDLIDSLRSVVTNAESEKTIDFVVEVDDGLKRVNTDKQHLFDILSELTVNALKFSQNGKISLNISKQAYNNVDWFSFAVSDDGPGIAPEKLINIFEEFEQLEDYTTRSQGGTGIGLSLAKKHAMLLGGDITVNSVVDQGSVFTLRFPSQELVN